jgi:phosphoribosylformylglycinamidine (FGAM) synthase-like enzyme
MRRSRLLTTVSVLQTVMAAGCVAIVVFLVWLTRNPEVVKGKDAAQAVYGLKVGALAVGIFTLPVVVGAVGLWMRKRWARWVAALPNILFIGAMLWDPVIDRERPELDDAVITLIFIAMTVLLLLPAVGRALRRDGERSVPAPAVSS